MIVGMKFKATGEESILGYKDIHILEKFLARTESWLAVNESGTAEPKTITWYQYSLFCFADGKYITIMEEDLHRDLGRGAYKVIE